MKLPQFTKNKKKKAAPVGPPERYIRLWVFSFICVGSIAILFFFLLNQTAELQTNYYDLENKALAQSKLKNNQQESASVIKKYEDDTLLQSTIPSEDNIIQFVEAFENAAKMHNVTQVIALQSEKKAIENGYASIHATIRIDGSLPNILAFLKDIEAQPFYINPTDISLTPGLTADQVSMVIELNTFWIEKQ